jgi:hypothetical protein
MNNNSHRVNKNSDCSMAQIPNLPDDSEVSTHGRSYPIISPIEYIPADLICYATRRAL